MPRRLAVNPRTNVITLRVTPKMRFGLELLAQEHGQTLTEVVIWAVNELFSTEQIGLFRYPAGQAHPVRALDHVWSPLEYERVVRLGIAFPELMSDRQKYLWGRVRETRKYWKAGADRERPTPDDVKWEALAKDWPDLERRARDAA